MDAFYASVEVLDKPELKGKPVIVGGSKRRGVVSSASYEARRYGVHSAQPISAAMRLCPKGIFLPVRMNRYREVSQQVFEIYQRFTPLVEPVSIDEAFLDVTGCVRLYGPPKKIAEMKIDLIMTESRSSQRGKKARWDVIADISKCSYSINQINQLLLQSGFVESSSITKIARGSLHS